MLAAKDFANTPLQNMVAVGLVEARAVRLWMRSERTGNLHLRWWPDGDAQACSQVDICVPVTNACDNTLSVRIPDDFPSTQPLTPLRPYRFRVTHEADGQLVGEGRFTTTPERPEDTPARYAIALMSCNQPFDEHGVLTAPSDQMLRATYRCLQAHNTKLVLTVGDQMYADSPPQLSLWNPAHFAAVAPATTTCLHECTAAEVRRLYQHRYRQFWSSPAWQAIHADYPCYPILDDHEIVDNWGSKPDHQQPQWQAIGEGARAAYLDYQGSRVLPTDRRIPASFDYTAAYGNFGLFVMDLRSNRTAGATGRLFSEAQAAALQCFLRQHRDKKCLGIVLSVPVVHLPRPLVNMVGHLTRWSEDFADRWASGAHIRDRNRLLHMLYTHQQSYPAQRLVLLSGDIHIGCVHELRWHPHGPRLYQLVSSGITNDIGWLMQSLSKLVVRCNRRVATDNALRAQVRLLRGVARQRQNPYGGLNVGMLEIETPTPNADPQLRFLLYSHRGESPVCVYRSPLLASQ
jgi:alkaline phosphatase D